MLGVTKLQMGIQTLDEEVSTINKRSITRKQIDTALDLTRLYGFKTHTHFMVNLLGATPESDRLDFKRFVTETPYQPDEIKLYPCALVQGTALCKEYEVGNWQPYNEETLVNILVDDVLETPAFTRISRMIRDFSAHDIVAGNKKVNLRQLVEEKAQTRLEQGARIEEIRYREISTQDVEVDELHLDIVPYETISTNEYFLQWVTPTNKIAGFLRLSLPKPQAFETYANQLQVFPDEAMIREVHVYGRAAGLHKQGTSAQHRGLGKKLIEEACALAKREGYKKINVISAVGVRAYYRRLGFVDGTLYQQRAL
jgi:elongator complex protein 3